MRKFPVLLVVVGFCLFLLCPILLVPAIAADEGKVRFEIVPPSVPWKPVRPPTPILWMVVPESVRVNVYSAAAVAEAIAPGASNFALSLPPGIYTYSITAKYRTLPPAPAEEKDGFGSGSFTLDGVSNVEIRGERYDALAKVTLRPALRLGITHLRILPTPPATIPAR